MKSILTKTSLQRQKTKCGKIHQLNVLPVVAAARKAASDAGSSKGRGAGIVTHVVPLGGAHAAALHVAPADTEAQARQSPDTCSVPEAGIVEPGLSHRGRI